MLRSAGVAFEAAPAELDERAMASGETDATRIASILAAAKAEAVSKNRPGDWVIGSDSVVDVEGRMFAKPRDRAQALEHLRGVRDEVATRELIVRENRQYSRRQLIWFRKEPNLQWIHAAGERAETFENVARALTLLEIRPDASVP
jgi:predicted house-cleaning NTP pyrophosphatase (Maf/HAM1 superfamily)